MPAVIRVFLFWLLPRRSYIALLVSLYLVNIFFRHLCLNLTKHGCCVAAGSGKDWNCIASVVNTFASNPNNFLKYRHVWCVYVVMCLFIKPHYMFCSFSPKSVLYRFGRFISAIFRQIPYAIIPGRCLRLEWFFT